MGNFFSTGTPPEQGDEPPQKPNEAHQLSKSAKKRLRKKKRAAQLREGYPTQQQDSDQEESDQEPKDEDVSADEGLCEVFASLVLETPVAPFEASREDELYDIPKTFNIPQNNGPVMAAEPKPLGEGSVQESFDEASVGASSFIASIEAECSGRTPCSLALSPEVQQLMGQLSSKHSACFIYGGFVRDSLLGALNLAGSDIDLLVVVDETEKAFELPEGFYPIPGMELQFRNTKLNIDMRLQKQGSLKTFLQNIDFKVNTFLVGADGRVHDLLNHLSALKNPYLEINDRERYERDPFLMARLLYLSVKVGKQIEPLEFLNLQMRFTRMRELPIGRYLRSLEMLFMTACGPVVLTNFCHFGLLESCIPPLSYSKEQRTDSMRRFWQSELERLIGENKGLQANQKHKSYTILALFLLPALLTMLTVQNASYEQALESVLESFEKALPKQDDQDAWRCVRAKTKALLGFFHQRFCQTLQAEAKPLLMQFNQAKNQSTPSQPQAKKLNLTLNPPAIIRPKDTK